MAVSRFIAVFSPQRERLLEIAHRLSPRVELYPPNGIILEVPVRCEQEVINGLAPWITEGTAIGGASSRAAAILAAATCSGTFVPYGRERSFVADLPVASLAVWPETDPTLLKSLEHWGIRTLGELSDLSENAFAARLGQRGVRLRRFIRGEEDPPSQPHQPERRFQVSRELDWTVYLLEPLTFVLGSMLEELCMELRGQGLAVETLRLSLRLEQGGVFEHSFRPAIPIQDAKNLLSLLRLELQSHCPQAGIRAITLQAEPARARIFQHSLLQPGAMHPEKLARTLSRLQALVGEDRVGSPQLVDTHRPDAVQLGEFRGARLFTALPEAPPNGENRLTLRRLRPPQTIELCGEEILACAGPWRSSGDWWLEGGASDGWSRDEWDIELTNGGIYRVFWDHIRRRWFLEGVYD